MIIENQNIDEFAGTLRDRALSPKDTDPHAELVEPLKRQMGGYIAKCVIPVLHSYNVSMPEVFRHLHTASTAGTKAYEEEQPEELRAGEYRANNVSFGEFIPPAYEDVQGLVEQFAIRLNELINQSTAASIDYVAAWAHVVFIAIHPYADGNGRTARALTEYVQFAYERKTGEKTRESTINIRGEEKDILTLRLNDLNTKLGLSPQTQYQSSLDTYYAAVSSGDKDEVDRFFTSIAAAISNHLQEQFTPEDMKSDPKFEDIISLFQRPLDKGKTKPLMAKYVAAVNDEVSTRWENK